MTSTPDDTGPIVETDDSGIQPLRDGDTSLADDPDARSGPGGMGPHDAPGRGSVAGRDRRVDRNRRRPG